MKNLPDKIEIIEVGPRDGFQNLTAFLATQDKLNVIDALVGAGVRRMEITSFMHPKAIPQMVDAETVTAEVLAKQYPGFKPIALVPNLKGAKRAWQAGLREVSYVISVSQAHNEANVRRTPEQSFTELREIRRELPDLSVRLDAATAFGCPFAGDVAPEAVLQYLEHAAACGIEEIILCDTIGVADPRQVYTLAAEAKRLHPSIRFGLHLHDTRGLGLANALAGMEAGITMLETSSGGLGGCPFAPGASGNTATEDLLYMLMRMHIDTGIDLDRYMEAVALLKTCVEVPLGGHLASVYRKKLTCM